MNLTGVGYNYLSNWGSYFYKQASSLVRSFLPTTNTKTSSRSVEISALHDDLDKPREKCGVFAYFSKNSDPDLGRKLYQGLIGIQHRGQQGSGIAYLDSSGMIKHDKGQVERNRDKPTEFKDSDAGLVNNVFDKKLVDAISGNFGIAHTLYATASGGSVIKAHPFVVGEGRQRIALVHNGNLSDLRPLENFLQEKNIPIENKSDSEMMADAIHWYVQNANLALKGAIEEASKLFVGTYSLLVMNKQEIVIARDPRGNRPLSVGKIKSETGTSFVVASETSVLKSLKAEFIRDIKPGEIFVLSQDTNEENISKAPEINNPEVLCALERIYLMKPNSMIGGKSVSETRRELGKETAKEFKTRFPGLKIDYVVPIPEGGVRPATGFAEELKLPINPVLLKNFHRRTFLDKGKDVEEKFSVVEDALRDKIVVVVDDSIVRGKSSEAIMKLLKETGPKEIHLVSASPMVLHPNYYGVDIATKEELIANQCNQDLTKIATKLGVDSVSYLSLDTFNRVVGEGKSENSIFDGDYKIPVKSMALAA